jgi:hypothetical protein
MQFVTALLNPCEVSAPQTAATTTKQLVLCTYLCRNVLCAGWIAYSREHRVSLMMMMMMMMMMALMLWLNLVI